jgi:hypothetical protein
LESQVKSLKQHRQKLMDKVREINKEKSKVRSLLDQADADARRSSPQPDLRRRASCDRGGAGRDDSRTHLVRADSGRHESGGVRATSHTSHRPERMGRDDRPQTLPRHDRLGRQERPMQERKMQERTMQDRSMSSRLDAATPFTHPPHHQRHARHGRDADMRRGAERSGGGGGGGDDDGDM